MKNYSTILLFLCLCYISAATYGQNSKPFKSNALEVGIGYADVEAGTWLSYIEYTRRLSPLVQLGVSGAYTQGMRDNRPWYDGKTTVWMGDMNLYFLPFHKLKSSNLLRTLFHLQTFKVGIGAGLRHVEQYRTIGSAMVGNQPDEFYTYSKNNNGLGFNLIVEHDIVVVKNWSLGLRASVHTYDGGEAADFLGANTGIKF